MLFHHLDLGESYKNIIALTVYQCSDNYLWVGTKTGLIRFDGYSTIHYGLKEGLSNEEIHAIHEDDNNSIWLGTRNGLNQMDKSTGTITNFLVSNKDERKELEWIHDIFEHKDGSFWISFAKGFVVHFNPQNGERYLYKTKEFAEDGSLAGSVYKIISFNNHLLAVSSLGLLRVDTTKKLLEPISIPALANVHLQDAASKGNTLFIVTQQGNIVQLENNMNITRELRTGLDNDFRFSLHVHDNALWLGTFQKGLYRYEIDDFNPTHFLYSDIENSIPDNTIRDFFDPGKGKLWMATDNGICKLDKYRFKFNPSNFKAFQDFHNEVFCIKSIGDSIFVGGNNGLVLFNGEILLEGIEAHDIWRYEDQKYFIAAGKDGLLKTNDFKRYDTLQTPNISPRVILEDENFIWVGGEGGLVRRDKKDHNETIFLSFEIEPVVSSMLLQNDTILWVGTWTKGLFRLNTQTLKYRQYHSETNTARGLSWGFINSMHLDRQGEIYVGTLTGVNIYDEVADRFHTLHISPNTENDHIYAMLPHENDTMLWLSTNYGLVLFDVDNRGFTIWDDNNGLPEVKFANSAAKLHDTLYFATKEGVVLIPTGCIDLNPHPPNLKASFISDDGKKTPIFPGATIIFTTDQKMPSIEMTGIELTVSQRNQYQWTFKKENDTFVRSGRDRTFFPGSLAPGTYSFSFTASNSDGVWNGNPMNFTLLVNKSWYTSAWVVGVVLVVVTILIILIRVFVRPGKSSKIERYARSNVAEEKLRKYVNLLDAWMEDEKPFKASAIYLDDVANHLNINSNLLSQAINQVKGVNFHEYINQQRVKEAKRLLSDPENKSLNLFGVGLEAGFNSKSTFYAVFKKKVGMTPARYRAISQK